MQIKNTSETAQHPWLDGTFLQGGDRGVVFRRDGGEPYFTAFVEAFSDTLGFVRGEGETILDAEDDAWNKAQEVLSCTSLIENGDHQWEARGYTNGGGFCATCNKFGSAVFDVKDVGIPCHVCDTKTNWSTIRTGDGEVWLCERHDVPNLNDAELLSGIIAGTSTWTEVDEWLPEQGERLRWYIERYGADVVLRVAHPDPDADFATRRDHAEHERRRIADTMKWTTSTLPTDRSRPAPEMP